MWHLVEQLLGFVHQPAANVGSEEGVPCDGVALGHFVEQSARAREVVLVWRSRIRGKKRVPRHGVADRHGVEEGTRGANVAMARECREERVPGDDGAGRDGIEEAPSGVEAAAAEERC